MKILLTGKNGQVGFELQRSFAPLGEIIPVDQADCDLSSPESIRQLVQTVKPDIIVNVAGWEKVGPFLDSTPDLWDQLAKINFLGPVRMIHGLLPDQTNQEFQL